MRCFVLSKENLELSRAEAVLGLGIDDAEYDGNLLLTESRKSPINLAYTEAVFEVGRYDVGTYAVRKLSGGPSERKVAEMLAIKGKVVLDKPDDEIVYAQGKKLYSGRLLWRNPKGFEERKAHRRPGFSPVSMHPRLARAMVNMAGPGTLLDPFCGTGGILIEAGLMGRRAVGYDIDENMLEMSRRNLEHFGVKDYSLYLRDARKIGNYRHIATDLPYGRNTKKIEMDSLYREFAAAVKGRAVIAFPSTYDYRKFLKPGYEFDIYIHKSLSKKIVVI